MDPQHADDMARISLESIHDWHQLKSNYTTAALRAFDDELKEARSTAERDALLEHLHQVRHTALGMTVLVWNSLSLLTGRSR